MTIITTQHIELLIHYHLSHNEHPRIYIPALRGFAQDLVLDGIFEEISNSAPEKINAPSYRLTEKGIAWLLMLLNTPYPVAKTIWFDQNGKPIDTKIEVINESTNVKQFEDPENLYKLSSWNTIDLN